MSTDRDTTRIVRSWLEEGVTALPDRVLDAVLDQVPATPQRRPSWPTRRFPPMNRIFLTAGAAAAVLVVAIVGYRLLLNPNGVGPQPSPSLTPSAIPPPTPSSLPPNPLVGIWSTGATTCEQQVATLEAAGFTTEQLASVEIDVTCASGLAGPGFSPGGRFRVKFDEGGGLEIREDDQVGAVAVYKLGEGSTFESWDVANDALCLTTRYTIEGDQLRLELIDPACGGSTPIPLSDQVAITVIYETVPYTRAAQP
jgi:hypothetical protein